MTGHGVEVDPNSTHAMCNPTPAAKVVPLIRTTFVRGSGSEDDPVRQVFGYFDFDGHLLAEWDPHTSPSHIEGIVR